VIEKRNEEMVMKRKIMVIVVVDVVDQIFSVMKKQQVVGLNLMTEIAEKMTFLKEIAKIIMSKSLTPLQYFQNLVEIKLL